MAPNYYPWDGLINRLRACDEHVAQLQEDDMANTDLDRWITGKYHEDVVRDPAITGGKRNDFDRWDWDQPDEAWGDHETDKEMDDDDTETV